MLIFVISVCSQSLATKKLQNGSIGETSILSSARTEKIFPDSVLFFFFCPGGGGKEQAEAGEDAEREWKVRSPDLLCDGQLGVLCSDVWPVLALIGGVDGGLRAGGACLHKPSGRRATLLGVVKEGSSLAKLQWEETDLTVR